MDPFKLLKNNAMEAFPMESLAKVYWECTVLVLSLVHLLVCMIPLGALFPLLPSLVLPVY